MNEKYTYYLRYACISSALAAALALGGCSLSDYFLGVEVRGFHGETKKNSVFFA